MNFKYSIAKTAKTTFTDQVIKDKKKVPGTGQYDTGDMSKFNKLARPNYGALKRGR